MNTNIKSASRLIAALIILLLPLIISTKQLSHNKVVNKLKNDLGTTLILHTQINKENQISESLNTASVPIIKSYPIIQTISSYNPNIYTNIINAAGNKYGVSSTLLNSIIACESGFNKNAYNPSGASGIAQFMPSTFYGSWNIYRNGGLWSARAQIYALALKISEGGISDWVCR
ncbi:lytic transglycosylase domain-containing protein [Patescibacteria group bacterium]|nr:lytic transglycosylase domain-containing protein [Patescibacteria group bacterium]